MSFNPRKRMNKHDTIVLHQSFDGTGPPLLTVQAQDFHVCPTCKAHVGHRCIEIGNDTGRNKIGGLITAGIHLKRFGALLKFYRDLERKEILKRLGAKVA